MKEKLERIALVVRDLENITKDLEGTGAYISYFSIRVEDRELFDAIAHMLHADVYSDDCKGAEGPFEAKEYAHFVYNNNHFVYMKF